ncbi:MAG TPA: ABC transporter permease [Methylomirabilota bacterium]|nr:ABC transporter permease [Methylomirabilota bacterium]
MSSVAVVRIASRLARPRAGAGYTPARGRDPGRHLRRSGHPRSAHHHRRAVGARDGYIMWRHIVPNCLAPVAVQVSLSFVEAVRTEATLSFLGLGVPPPAPSWGNMLDDGRVFLQTAPWMILFPAGALALTILGMSLLGDGLRDALDPKLRSH